MNRAKGEDALNRLLHPKDIDGLLAPLPGVRTSKRSYTQVACFADLGHNERDLVKMCRDDDTGTTRAAARQVNNQIAFGIGFGGQRKVRDGTLYSAPNRSLRAGGTWLQDEFTHEVERVQTHSPV